MPYRVCGCVSVSMYWENMKLQRCRGWRESFEPPTLLGGGGTQWKAEHTDFLCNKVLRCEYIIDFFHYLILTGCTEKGEHSDGLNWKREGRGYMVRNRDGTKEKEQDRVWALEAIIVHTVYGIISKSSINTAAEEWVCPHLYVCLSIALMSPAKMRHEWGCQWAQQGAFFLLRCLETCLLKT